MDTPVAPDPTPENVAPGNEQVLPAGLVVTGGVLTGLSTFFLWFELEVGSNSPENSEYSGLDLLQTLGYGLIAFSLLLLAFGAVLFVRGKQGRAGRGWAIAALVVAALVALTGAIAVMQPTTSLGEFGGDEVAEEYGIEDGVDVTQELRDAEDENAIRVQSGLGALLGLGGGILALVGAGMNLTRARSARPETPPAAADPPQQ